MVDRIVTYMGASFPFFSGLNSVLNVKALVLGTFNQEKALVLGAFNQEKALVRAFSVIVKSSRAFG